MLQLSGLRSQEPMSPRRRQGRREASEQSAAHATERASATERSLNGARSARLGAGGHAGEGAGVVASGALVLGHGRAQVAQRHPPLFRRQLGEGLLVGLLERVRWGGPHEIAVALERLLVRQFAGGWRRRGSVLRGL